MHSLIKRFSLLILLAFSCFAKDNVFMSPESFNTYISNKHLKIDNFKIQENTCVITKEIMLANYHNYNNQLFFDKEHNSVINKFNPILEKLNINIPHIENPSPNNTSTLLNNTTKPTFIQFQKYIEDGGSIYQFIIKTKSKTEKHTKEIKCPNCHGTGTYEKFTIQSDETVTTQCKRCHGEGSIKETSTSKKQLPPELEIKRFVITANK